MNWKRIEEIQKRMEAATAGTWGWVDRNGIPIDARSVTRFHADGTQSRGRVGKACELVAEIPIEYDEDGDVVEGEEQSVLVIVSRGGKRFLEFTPENGAFIAQARADIAALLDELAHLQISVAVAADWLHSHGQHPSTCAAIRGGECDCNLSAILSDFQDYLDADAKEITAALNTIRDTL